jgi:hypothetical protein
MADETNLDNPAHWRALAEKARAIVRKLKDPEARRIMLGVVTAYEQMARLAEARVAAKGSPKKSD